MGLKEDLKHGRITKDDAVQTLVRWRRSGTLSGIGYPGSERWVHQFKPKARAQGRGPEGRRGGGGEANHID